MSKKRCPTGQLWDKDTSTCMDRMDKLQKLKNKDYVAVEMARRKKAFHNTENWNEIDLWGLFNYTNIKRYLDDGRLINNHNYRPENKTYWVIPSKNYWEKSIRPIVNTFTKAELQETF